MEEQRYACLWCLQWWSVKQRRWYLGMKVCWWCSFCAELTVPVPIGPKQLDQEQ